MSRRAIAPSRARAIPSPRQITVHCSAPHRDAHSQRASPIPAGFHRVLGPRAILVRRHLTDAPAKAGRARYGPPRVCMRGSHPARVPTRAAKPRSQPDDVSPTAQGISAPPAGALHLPTPAGTAPPTVQRNAPPRLLAGRTAAPPRVLTSRTTPHLGTSMRSAAQPSQHRTPPIPSMTHASSFLPSLLRTSITLAIAMHGYPTATQPQHTISACLGADRGEASRSHQRHRHRHRTPTHGPPQLAHAPPKLLRAFSEPEKRSRGANKRPIRCTYSPRTAARQYSPNDEIPRD
ncbi:hypothetical protein HYPSUDRAFT_205689 [Hypholoma sublateritium FD-334 SS-4]|uniref:Uncharacterized protein n=1 Tax=Hypholoma sublateritium (strain FD-334 SS-4) TaxID=945553 RepID=A0A0D2NMV9_HYPSF|nr:hypothetical protein HYPSUDRAFT_205689 [Hypholoma sublateritium FD-334 SS-4]